MVKLTIGTCLAGGWLRAGQTGEGGRGEEGESRYCVARNKFSFPRKRYAAVVLSFFTLNPRYAIHKGGLRSIERAVQSRANVVTTRPCSKDIAHGPDAIKAGDRSRKNSPPPPFILFFRIFFFSSSQSNNFLQRIFACICIYIYSCIYQLSRLVSYFSIKRIRDILSERSFSIAACNVVSFLFEWSHVRPITVISRSGRRNFEIDESGVDSRTILSVESMIRSTRLHPLAVAVAKMRATSRERDDVGHEENRNERAPIDKLARSGLKIVITRVGVWRKYARKKLSRSILPPPEWNRRSRVQLSTIRFSDF